MGTLQSILLQNRVQNFSVRIWRAFIFHFVRPSQQLPILFTRLPPSSSRDETHGTGVTTGGGGGASETLGRTVALLDQCVHESKEPTISSRACAWPMVGFSDKN